METRLLVLLGALALILCTLGCNKPAATTDPAADPGLPPDAAVGTSQGTTAEPAETPAAEPEAKAPAEAADDEGYTKTDSGLKYKDTEEGTGAVAEPGKTVSVHYTGTLEDGTKFDSSLDRGEPFEFALGAGSVIAGWDEGVAGMKVGGKRKLVIPSDLGYGAQGMPPVIPPDSTLLFDVELLDVK